MAGPRAMFRILSVIRLCGVVIIFSCILGTAQLLNNALQIQPERRLKSVPELGATDRVYMFFIPL